MTYSQALEQVRTAVYGQDVLDALLFLFENYGTKLTIGTVTRGDTASASIESGKLDLVLPKGDTGPIGAKGSKGDRGDTGPQGPKGDTGPAGASTAEAIAAANEAKAAADKAAAAASDCSTAQSSVSNNASSAKSYAERAEAAASRAEGAIPKDGFVASVNGKGGNVVLDFVKSVALAGRTLTVTMENGTSTTFTTQDTTALGSMSGVLDVAHGGTGKSTALTAADVGAMPSGSAEYIQNITFQNGQITVTNGAGTTTNITPYELTAEKIDTALGYDLAKKLNELKGVTNMDGKLIYTGTGSVDGFKNATLTIPAGVDYVVVRMIQPMYSSNATDYFLAVAADYGSTRIARGGTAVALIGTATRSSSTTVTFAADGTLTISMISGSDGIGFNVEGYQYA